MPKQDKQKQETRLQELEEEQAELTRKLLKERNLRNYYQLERDQVAEYWRVAKEELGKLENEDKTADRDMETSEQRHQVEMRIYKQKVRHLVYEHKLAMERLRNAGQDSMENQNQEFGSREDQLSQIKQQIRDRIQTEEEGQEERVQQLRRQHESSIAKTKQQYEDKLAELERMYEQRVASLKEELELRRKAEIHDIEERKNEHIKQLMQRHREAFQRIKAYYNDTTTSNLMMIRGQKDTVAEMARNKEHNHRLMFLIAQENKNLSPPLAKALEEAAQLRRELASYDKDKDSLKQGNARVSVLEDTLRRLRWDHEMLLNAFGTTQEQRDVLYDRFDAAVSHVQGRTEDAQTDLRRQVEEAEDGLARIETSLDAVMEQGRRSQSDVDDVAEQVEEMLEERNQTLRDLRFEVQKAAKGYNDTARALRSQVVEAGIPEPEADQLWDPIAGPAAYGTSRQPGEYSGPAGLVTQAPNMGTTSTGETS
eukprot:gb/GECH01014272.1/.p1 GENE.gb/GECH01014272.1/~~gb/GECH01014272.1/.p1  ORF type:complete len:482 (+),score=122.72 gb/GECH01014272.1/:1-1446(+)